MGTQRYAVEEIQGFLPSVEATRADTTFLLGGRNYVFDIKGPRSDFGSSLLSPIPLQTETYQSFRFRYRRTDRTIAFTDTAILEWRELSGGWTILYMFPSTSANPYRWTWGFLSGILYMAHPSVGLIRYDPETDLCWPHNPPGLLDGVISVGVSFGRLVVLTEEFIQWSHPSDGNDFTPEISGAGFQLLADQVSGSPILLTTFAAGASDAGGVLTWTSSGIMVSYFVGGQEVFRHRLVRSESRPINNFCLVTQSDDSTWVLDESGLFSVSGINISSATPLFNEFLLDYIQGNNLKEGVNVRLDWDSLRTRLYISVSTAPATPEFDRTFVLYPPIDKWGEFNFPHHGIGALEITNTQRRDSYFGFMDPNGIFNLWDSSGTVETPGRRAGDVLHLNPQAIPTTIRPGSNGVIEAAGWVSGSGVNVTSFPPLDGYLTRSLETYVTPKLGGLDARIEIGYFRAGNLEPDHMVEITSLLIRSLPSAHEVQDSLDFSLPDVSAVTAFVGLVNPPQYVNHGLNLVATLDGVEVFQQEHPIVALQTRNSRQYVCSLTGIWHVLHFDATNPGEAFAPTVIEMTFTDGGLYS